VLVVLTEWPEFAGVDLDKVASVDARATPSSTAATCSTRRVTSAAGPSLRGGRALMTGDRTSSPAAPASSDRTSAIASSIGATTCSASTTAAPARRQHRAPRRPRPVPVRRASTSCSPASTSDRRRVLGRPAARRACSTSRARRRRPNTSAARSTPSTWAAPARALLDIALAHGARFFLASTSEVYGDPSSCTPSRRATGAT
jgi:hypothetical protein